MPKRIVYPRNEQSLRDRVLGTNYYNHATRNHASRNDALTEQTFNSAALTLTGTVVPSVDESEINTGGETVILTLSGALWRLDVGGDNEITDALIASFDGDLSFEDIRIAGSWDPEMFITHPDVVRTSDTVVTITLPATAAFDLLEDETVTIDIPSICTMKGFKPTVVSFTIDGAI